MRTEHRENKLLTAAESINKLNINNAITRESIVHNFEASPGNRSHGERQIHNSIT